MRSSRVSNTSTRKRVRSCFFYVLLYGEVIVVTPIVSTTPLFAMLTAMLFGVERITRRVVTSVLIVVVGVALVSVQA